MGGYTLQNKAFSGQPTRKFTYFKNLKISKLFAFWLLSHAFLWSPLIFFQNQLSGEIMEEYNHSVKQFVYDLSGLVWVQTVCKGYQ